MQELPTRQLMALVIALGAGFAPTPVCAAGTKAPEVAGAPEPMKSTPAENGNAWAKLDQETAALVAQHPQDANARNLRGGFLWQNGEREKAVEQWEIGARLDPANAQILGHLAGAAMDSGEMRKSAGYYERALAVEPGNAGLHFALANLQFLFRHELKDAAHPDPTLLLTGALGHFAAASQLAPENVDYARAYAETFYSLPAPDWTAALAAWRHFSLLTPQKDFARLNLARVHLKLNQWAEARQELTGIQSDTYQRLKVRLGAQIEAQAEKAAKNGGLAPSSPRPENSSKPGIDGEAGAP